MSERTYFNLRDTIPGFTFILISILAAFPGLHEIFSESKNVSLATAFLVFLSLLSGGAIGFLISQIWHLGYREFLKERHTGRIRNFLNRNYDLPRNADIQYQYLFLDYVGSLASVGILADVGKGLESSSQRRFDLMHTCGSSIVAIMIGLTCGYLIRIGSFSTNHSVLLCDYLLVFIVAPLLIVLLVVTYCHTAEEHEMLSLLWVRMGASNLAEREAQIIFANLRAR